MALFNSKEEKALKKQQKLDAKEQEHMDKIREKLHKKHLDGIDPEYYESCSRIMTGLMGTGLMEAGKTLSVNYKPEDQLKITYLRTIVDQNWVMIRQLDRITKALEKDNSK